MMKKRISTAALGGALVLLASAFGGAQAQSVERADLAILNDHLHVHKVFVVDARGEQHQLGFVGHDQLKTFDIPAQIELMGPYRIAFQQYLPLAGVGVSAEAPPFKVTPVLSPLANETVTIVVGGDVYLSTVEVGASRLTAARP
jgi:hypothetical protein